MRKRFQLPLLIAGVLYSSLTSNLPQLVAESPAQTKKGETNVSLKQTDSDFIQAQEELKKLVGELTELQAEYQQPNADKISILFPPLFNIIYLSFWYLTHCYWLLEVRCTWLASRSHNSRTMVSPL